MPQMTLKKSQSSPIAYISGYIQSDHILDKLSSDIYGPFEWEDGISITKKYLILFTDVFTRSLRYSFLVKHLRENKLQKILKING